MITCADRTTCVQCFLMEVLSKLFGSIAKVKLIRIFLFHPDAVFDLKFLSEKSKLESSLVRRECSLLASIDLIKRKTFQKTEDGSRGGVRSKTTNGFALNKNFPYLVPLKALLLESGLMVRDEIVAHLAATGKIKLLLAAGVFLNDSKGRIDLLIVGDYLKKESIEKAVLTIESEIGRDLSYAFFETKEFQYRLGMYDKFIRDILDYPHERLIQKIKID